MIMTSFYNEKYISDRNDIVFPSITLYEQKCSNIKHGSDMTKFVIKNYFNWFELNHISVGFF